MNARPSYRIALAWLVACAMATGVEAQENVNGRIVTELGVEGAALLAAQTQVFEGFDKRTNRAFSLAAQGETLYKTYEIDKQKRANDSLQRVQITRLTNTLQRTLEDFESYYEKFQLVRTAVKSLAEAKRFKDRIAHLAGVLDELAREISGAAFLTPEELELFAGMVSRLRVRAGRIIELSALALLDSETTDDEMDAIREEHGEFFVLAKTLDRTEQIAAVNAEIGAVARDITTRLRQLTETSAYRGDDEFTAAIHALYD